MIEDQSQFSDLQLRKGGKKERKKMGTKKAQSWVSQDGREEVVVNFLTLCFVQSVKSVRWKVCGTISQKSCEIVPHTHTCNSVQALILCSKLHGGALSL